MDCFANDGSCFGAAEVTTAQIWQLPLLLLLPMPLPLQCCRRKKRTLTVEHLTLQKLKTIYSLNSRIQFKVLDKMRQHIFCVHEWIWKHYWNAKIQCVNVCLCVCYLRFKCYSLWNWPFLYLVRFVYDFFPLSLRFCGTFLLSLVDDCFSLLCFRFYICFGM